MRKMRKTFVPIFFFAIMGKRERGMKWQSKNVRKNNGKQKNNNFKKKN